MNTKEKLIAARKVLETNEWVQGSYIKDHAEYITDYRDSNACKFCMVGAVFFVEKSWTETNSFKRIVKKLSMVIKKVIPKNNKLESCYSPERICTIYNDDIATTKEDVLKIFDIAIGEQDHV